MPNSTRTTATLDPHWHADDILAVASLPTRVEIPGEEVAYIASTLGLVAHNIEYAEWREGSQHDAVSGPGRWETVADSVFAQLQRFGSPLLIGQSIGGDNPLEEIGSKAAKKDRRLRVMFPLDGKMEPSRSIRSIISMLAGKGSDLLIVHIFDDATRPMFWEGPGHNEEAWSNEFMLRYFGRNDAILHVHQGLTPVEIAKIAGHEDVDVVVLEWGGSDQTERCRTIRGLLDYSTTPLLIVPQHWRSATYELDSEGGGTGA